MRTFCCSSGNALQSPRHRYPLRSAQSLPVDVAPPGLHLSFRIFPHTNGICAPYICVFGSIDPQFPKSEKTRSRITTNNMRVYILELAFNGAVMSFKGCVAKCLVQVMSLGPAPTGAHLSRWGRAVIHLPYSNRCLCPLPPCRRMRKHI
jgi:hypothetical protein